MSLNFVMEIDISPGHNLNLTFLFFRREMSTETMGVGMNDLADTLNEVAEESSHHMESPHVSVKEVVIFCIDKFVLLNHVNGEPLGMEIHNMLRSYLNIKKKISVKQVEFEILFIIGNKQIIRTPIIQIRDIQIALSAMKSIHRSDECEPFNFDRLFTELAENIQLPDPNFCTEVLPPPVVYHAILLFGHNKYVPVMEDTNAFDYLMMTPYFALDILYIYDNQLKRNRCDQISQALTCLNENNRGYYFPANKFEIDDQYSYFAQFLGHPLIRRPQSKAKFNIDSLGPSGDDEDIDH